MRTGSNGGLICCEGCSYVEEKEDGRGLVTQFDAKDLHGVERRDERIPTKSDSEEEGGGTGMNDVQTERAMEGDDSDEDKAAGDRDRE
jgi:hypothetical protein